MLTEQIFTWDDLNLTIINESFENNDIRIRFFQKLINKFIIMTMNMIKIKL